MSPGLADAEAGGQEHTPSSAWLAAPASSDADGHSELPPGSWPFGWNSPVFTTFTPGNSPAGELFPSQVDEEN